MGILGEAMKVRTIIAEYQSADHWLTCDLRVKFHLAQNPLWVFPRPSASSTKQVDIHLQQSTKMSSTSFQLILDAAIADYAKQTGIDPIKHPFADRLQTSHSPDDILKLLGDKASEFENYREGNRELIGCLKPVVTVIHAFSGFLVGAVSLVPFQPVGAIFVGLDILLSPYVIWMPQAASGVSSSYDALVDLFDCVGNFLNVSGSTPISRWIYR
ncbi:hypothetical protein EDB84DRAFT_1674893 [Lactarius hengduanensis]|nr:hypothetical protein EDB84DRAFT_1674893 [Lactarius hengduanensis]